MNRSKSFLILFFLIQSLYIYLYSDSKSLNILKQNDLNLDDIFQQPLIFVGGFKSSGTSLVRSLLDVHPECKCGPEIKIAVDSFNFLKTKSLIDLDNNNPTRIKIEKAMGLFAFYNYFNNVPPVQRICNKEPSNFQHIKFLKRVFPNSKFILVVRDGRESSYSWLRRTHLKKTFANFLRLLNLWNWKNQNAYKQCMETGTSYCKIIYYNKLVNEPKQEIEEMVKFLNLSWTDKFLNHQKYLRKDIILAKREFSIYGLKKKINNNSLNNWVGKVTDYNEDIVLKQIDMLQTYKFI